MNIRRIRIRMPKWQAIRSANWAKELLMTFIGATLSIILTFGTAHILDKKQQREDGSQTAMMVIHDMENTAEIFQSYATMEEQYFNIAQSVRTNKDNGQVNSDSLLALVSYLIVSSGESYTFDDSGERVFLSSQEVWKTIDNPSFIDAVQEFFQSRRQIYNALNSDRFFAKPISNDEYFQLVLENPDPQGLDTAFWVNVTKKYIERPEVSIFIDYSFVRRRYFNEYADNFRSMANRCKFMMGITDEELMRYVQNKSRIGKPLKDQKLIGKWQAQTADDLYVEKEFRKDHTSRTHMRQYMSYSYYTGQIVLDCTLYGTWDIQGDSLITTQLSDYTYDFDKSNIHYQPKYEETINTLLETWKQSVIVSLENMTKGEQRKSVFASIDPSGNKIELRESEGVIYLTRCGKP